MKKVTEYPAVELHDGGDVVIAHAKGGYVTKDVLGEFDREGKLLKKE